MSAGEQWSFFTPWDHVPVHEFQPYQYLLTKLGVARPFHPGSLEPAVLNILMDCGFVERNTTQFSFKYRLRADVTPDTVIAILQLLCNP